MGPQRIDETLRHRNGATFAALGSMAVATTNDDNEAIIEVYVLPTKP
jgi:hypothetical protein